MKSRLALSLAAALSWVGAPLAATAEKELLWGDTHLHTSNSFDAYLNANTTADPDTAYRYAKGLPVIHPGHRALVQIETPLDFLVIADHAELLGAMPTIIGGDGIPRDGLGFVDQFTAWYTERFFRNAVESGEGAAAFAAILPTETDVREAAKGSLAGTAIPNIDLMARNTWNVAIQTADLHNDPGTFTTLIGWEWSSIPAGANLHRVVFTSAGAETAAQFLPWSSIDSAYPEDLWKWLEKTTAETGAQFTAIPHNSNISKGYMFPTEERLNGTPIDADWAKLRAKWETVVEVTQLKGDSETHPAVSPDDPFADFETYPHYIEQNAPPYDPGEGDYARSALKNGLAIEERIGFNPYRFGMIGATDAHTGVASAEEPNFWGKFPGDGIPEGATGQWRTAGGPNGWSMSASGLAAVWAESNTRDAILEAFRRREVYATTGPRLVVRVFGGTNFAPADANATDIEAVGRAKGVPMGGELADLQEAPSFLVHAAKDPRSAHLDRIQMVKGWLTPEGTREKVYDIAWAGDRAPDADGRVPPVPDTVDRTTATWTDEHGAPALATVWTDPDFDPSQRAFYYVRVLEVPTPRHSLRDAIALGIDPSETGKPSSIQERAYTSPIHVRP